MRLLILSDAHANIWALQAIERDADAFNHVIFAGDAVNYGPTPQEAIGWLRDHQIIGVRGNHDHAIAYGVDPKVSPAKERLARTMSDWTRRQLEEADIEWLSKLPTSLTWESCGLKCAVFHATPRDPLYDYHLTPEAGQELFEEFFAGVKADVVITGHTHLPFMRDYRQIHIVNPGSAGQPLDGDPRAAYAIWEDGSLELHRVSYDQTPLLHAIGNLPLEPLLIEDLSNIIRHGSIQLQGNPRSVQCR